MGENQPVIEMLDVATASPLNADVPQTEHIKWRVCAGEFWVIGGFQGSGKATLLSAAAALQNPLRGVVKLFGRDVSSLRERDLQEERRKIGFVFEQGGRMFSHMTVAENVALPLRYHHNWKDEEISRELEKLLTPLGLMPHTHQLSGSLGSGWQQRVALARALALKPEILLLDRPIDGVERRHRRWWFDFLPKLNSTPQIDGLKPMTLVVTADDLTPWLEHGTHFAALKNNQWQFLGDRDTLKKNQRQLEELWSDEFVL